MTRVMAFAVLALIAFPRGGPIAAPADEITPATVVAVERWVAAVRNHTPGQYDAAVEMVSALTIDKRRELDPGMRFFLNAVRGKPVDITTPARKRLDAVATRAWQNPGVDAFLKRAALLHADTALKRHLEGVDFTEPAKPAAREDLSSPLLSQGSLFVNRDGEVLGQMPSDWNWPFARSLLTLLSPSPAPDPFVATWYHATTAFMLRRGLYGEAVSHLQRAAIVLPDDARVLFDRACYAEIQGLPRSQVLLSDQDVLALRAARRQSNTIRTPTSVLPLGIPPEDETNDEAERLFRLALRADPAFVEARVRLGRLLGLRKRHDEAASELATALAANPTGPVLFYAHLFAGRAAQQQGKITAASEHYKAADALFPGAQSAGLARSQAALLESDVFAAQDSIRRMDKSSSAVDPWWWYQLGAGRDADALLREMWAQVPKW
jgi:tetratricopeptide (TPR) repeat protein